MLEFKGVSFRYEADGQDLFRDLSFSVQQHEFISVIGASGCGKSTIFRLINGLEAMQSGEICLNGRPIAEASGPVSAFMPQRDLLLPWRTAAENVALPMEIQGIGRRERRERALAALETVGLADCADQLPHTLSGGMRQRAAFARTLSAGADLLLLDEPFSALDALTRTRMQQWLMDQCVRTARTVLFVTHDVDEAIFLSDRILVMEGQPVDRITSVTVPMSRLRSRADMNRPELADLRLDLLSRLCLGTDQMPVGGVS